MKCAFPLVLAVTGVIGSAHSSAVAPQSTAFQSWRSVAISEEKGQKVIKLEFRGVVTEVDLKKRTLTAYESQRGPKAIATFTVPKDDLVKVIEKGNRWVVHPEGLKAIRKGQKVIVGTTELSDEKTYIQRTDYVLLPIEKAGQTNERNCAWRTPDVAGQRTRNSAARPI